MVWNVSGFGNTVEGARGYNPNWQQGLLVEPKYSLPFLICYFYNAKRLILQNQARAFAIVEAQMNSFFTNLGIDKTISLPLYDESDIRLGVSPEPNARAIFIHGKVNYFKDGSNYYQQEVELRIAGTTGPANTFDDAYTLSDGYAAAFEYIFLTMFDSFYQELCFGWDRKNYPHLLLIDENHKPQVAVMNQNLGSFPELVITFRTHTGVKNK